MRSLALVVVVFLLAAPLLLAGGLDKAYFAATLPGAWAQHESTWEMSDGTGGTNIYTHIRAPDNAGRALVEIDTETMAGPGAGTINRQLFVMEPGFDLAQDFLNYMMFLEASVAQSGDGPPTVLQDNVIEIMRDYAADLTNSVTFKGQGTRGGIACDHYVYSYTSEGPDATLQEGEICLNDTVPFGVVFQKGRVTDASGNLVSSFEQKLVDSGTGRSGTAVLLAVAPKAAEAGAEGASPQGVSSLSLLEAYQTGRIRLAVEVEEGTGGRRLRLAALSTTEEPFELVVPMGPLTIPADSPLGELRLMVAEDQKFSLSPGGSTPPFEAGQPGDRGATGGAFQLVVYEGQPLFQGSVEVGPLD